MVPLGINKGVPLVLCVALCWGLVALSCSQVEHWRHRKKN